MKSITSQLDEGKAAALTAATDRIRYDKLFAEKVISAQEHTNKTQTDEASKAKVKALEAAVVDAELNPIGAINARATRQTLVTSTSAPETAIHSQA